MAEVTDVDTERRQVVLDRGDRLGYDSLIVACGGETSYFGHDEWADVSCGLKTLADAVDLRNRIYGAFEQAERTDDAAARVRVADVRRRRRRATGVEVAGALALIAQHWRRRVSRASTRRRAGDPARRRRARARPPSPSRCRPRPPTGWPSSA